MSAERTPEDRAAVHAALADPARLRIVDHLSLGDAAPSELQALLGISSNLLAHHLGVLQNAGLVVRGRSAADRRRSYLSLVPATLDGLTPAGLVPVTRVLFVCTANSARSQLAAALWSRTSAVPVASAGTHPAPKVAARAAATARRHGLRLAGARPRPLAEVLLDDDFVVTVCDHAHEELRRAAKAPAALDAALHWSVPDPVSVDTNTAFDAVVEDLDLRITRLAHRLIPAS
jgi:protein-tyrosine-phosphatase/DNA-binding HxlR family transcriptional regulator